MKKEENNKLSENQSQGLKAKIRRGILIFLSSIGIATLVTNIPRREEPKGTKVESDIDREQRNHFIKSLKTVKNNESIIDEIIENKR